MVGCDATDTRTRLGYECPQNYSQTLEQFPMERIFGVKYGTGSNGRPEVRSNGTPCMLMHAVFVLVANNSLTLRPDVHSP